MIRIMLYVPPSLILPHLFYALLRASASEITYFRVLDRALLQDERALFQDFRESTISG